MTRFEAEFDLAFHRRVREGFRTLAAADPERFAVLDATGSADAVAEAAVDIVDAMLQAGEPRPTAARTTR